MALDFALEVPVFLFGNGPQKLLFAQNDDGERLEHDLDVQPQRRVHRIIHVVILAVLDAQVSVPAHLAEAGHARADLKLDQLPVFVLVVVHGQQGAGRNKTHLAAQDVDQLRQLVDLEFADETAHFGDVCIAVFDDGMVFIEHDVRAFHGPEFIAVELSSACAGTALFEDDGPAVFRLDGDRHAQKQGADRDQRDQCHHEIHGIFESYVDSVHAD